MQWLNEVPRDKLMHYAVGTILYCVGYLVVWQWAIAGVIVAAVGKEVYDREHKNKHVADVWDAVATVIGGLICMLPTL